MNRGSAHVIHPGANVEPQRILTRVRTARVVASVRKQERGRSSRRCDGVCVDGDALQHNVLLGPVAAVHRHLFHAVQRVQPVNHVAKHCAPCTRGDQAAAVCSTQPAQFNRRSSPSSIAAPVYLPLRCGCALYVKKNLRAVTGERRRTRRRASRCASSAATRAANSRLTGCRWCWARCWPWRGCRACRA